MYPIPGPPAIPGPPSSPPPGIPPPPPTEGPEDPETPPPPPTEELQPGKIYMKEKIVEVIVKKDDKEVVENKKIPEYYYTLNSIENDKIKIMKLNDLDNLDDMTTHESNFSYVPIDSNEYIRINLEINTNKCDKIKKRYENIDNRIRLLINLFSTDNYSKLLHYKFYLEKYHLNLLENKELQRLININGLEEISKNWPDEGDDFFDFLKKCYDENYFNPIYIIYIYIKSIISDFIQKHSI